MNLVRPWMGGPAAVLNGCFWSRLPGITNVWESEVGSKMDPLGLETTHERVGHWGICYGVKAVGIHLISERWGNAHR